MGITFLVAIALSLFLIIFRVMKYFALKDYKYYRVYMTIYEAVFFNVIIRYVIQSTLKLQVASYTTLTSISFSNASEIS